MITVSVFLTCNCCKKKIAAEAYSAPDEQDAKKWSTVILPEGWSESFTRDEDLGRSVHVHACGAPTCEEHLRKIRTSDFTRKGSAPTPSKSGFKRGQLIVCEDASGPHFDSIELGEVYTVLADQEGDVVETDVGTLRANRFAPYP